MKKGIKRLLAAVVAMTCVASSSVVLTGCNLNTLKNKSNETPLSVDTPAEKVPTDKAGTKGDVAVDGENGDAIEATAFDPEKHLVIPDGNNLPQVDSEYLLELLGDGLKVHPGYEEEFADNQWKYIDYSTSGETAFVYSAVEFVPKASEDRVAVAKAYNGIVKALENDGFVLKETNKFGVNYYVNGGCEFSIWDVNNNHRLLEIKISTGYQAHTYEENK